MSHRLKILSEIRSVPMIPHAAVQATIALLDENADFVEAAAIIRQDPCLAADILKLANSVAFGGRSTIDTIEAAITRLGTRKTLDLLTSVTVKPYAMTAIGGYDLPAGALWKHSVATACGAELLAELLQVAAPTYIFTAALLIDIGKFAMRQVMGDAIQQVLDAADQSQIPFEEAEAQVLGIDHAEAGAELLAYWHLPPSLSAVVRWHHLPDKAPAEYRLATQIVHVADQFTTSCGISTGIDGLRYRVSEQAVCDLKITPHIIEQTLCGIMDRMGALTESAA